jgi:flagellar hook protein FlgE
VPLNSLADALTGLQANQTYMNVVGNNISNVNTTSFKTQDIHFSDLLNETLVNDSAAGANLEGTNALQIGLGVGGGSISLLNTQGSEQDTGRLNDLTIQGGGFFVLSNAGGGNNYTRDGSFNVAPDGSLESGSTGLTVKGWSSLNADGTVNTTTPLSSIKLPLTSVSVGASANVALSGNLDASQATYVPAVVGPPAVAASGGNFTTSMTVFDSQGVSHTFNLQLTKNATANTWDYTIAAPTGSTDTVTGGNTGQLTFDTSGNLTAPTTMPVLTMTYGANNAVAAGSVTVDFSKLTQIASTSQVNIASVDGSAGGTLATYSIGKDGKVTAVYSNGASKTVGQIALANFTNVDDLQRMGNNMYQEGANSGKPIYGQAGSGTLGTIATGQLEGSNVDLAAQFGQMIQAQQGFNANTKVITTTNNMLQALISIVP